MLKLRKDYRAMFVYGNFQLFGPNSDDVFAYTRSNGTQRLLVVCNFREYGVSWKTPKSLDLSSGNVLVSNYIVELGVAQNEMFLRPFEAFAVLLG